LYFKFIFFLYGSLGNMNRLTQEVATEMIMCPLNGKAGANDI
jgi:hypothetical protein